MYIPIWVLALIGGFAGGVFTMFVVGILLTWRQRAQTARILEAVREQEQDDAVDVAV